MIPEKIKLISKEISNNGGCAFLVGGSVRDHLLKSPVKDFDVEVYGLKLPALKKIVGRYGKAKEVGKTFGVIKIFTKEELEIDFSLPRKDIKIARGHRGFKITTDPALNYKKALKRRDFTINSILLDPLTGEFIDPFNGREDLKKRVLRVTDKTTFAEDPLRVLRAIQLVARYELKIEPRSRKIIKAAAPRLKELSKDRIWTEWKKLLLAHRPSLGLEAARELGLTKTFYPMLAALEKTHENPAWHPEKNVWQHCKLTADQAALIAATEKLNLFESTLLVLAGICHDLGKPLTSRIVNGVRRTIGHAKAGEKPAREFLKAIGAPNIYYKKILGLVLYHMRPLSWYLGTEEFSSAGIRRLARDLHPYGLTFRELARLSLADNRGLGEFPPAQRLEKKREKERFITFLKKLEKRAASLRVLSAQPKAVVSGRDLLKLGFKPGPNIGAAMRLAEDLGDLNFKKTAILKKMGKITRDNTEKKVILKLQSLVKTRQ